MKLTLSAFINLENLKYDMSGNYAASIFSLIVIPLGLIYPLLMAYCLYKAENPSSQTTSLTERLRYKNWVRRVTHLVELMRLYLTVSALVIFREIPSLQIIILYILTLAKQAFFLNLSPFECKADNVTGVINEVLVTITLMLYIGIAECRVISI